MKYYLIAGEASGDLHGSNLMKGLRESDPDARFRFWGGDMMAAAGGGDNLAKHYRDASFFGITEVVKNLRTVLGQIKECKDDVVAFEPDVLILIDYPGFNFRMAKFAHERGLKVFYYISPKVWAWKESRVERIRRYVDRLFVIFPFEVDYFRKKGIEAIYEGNPLVDSVEQRLAAVPSREEFLSGNGLDDRPMVALLAGSRASEVRNNLSFMVELAGLFPDYQFVVAGVSWLDRTHYEPLLEGTPVRYVCDKTCELLKYSEAAVVASGTATLEAALIGTPEVVCYKVDAFSAWFGRIVIKVPYISLVNLIMGREVVRELIQRDMSAGKAAVQLREILHGGAGRERMLEEFADLRRIVGPAGASRRFAAKMVSFLKLRIEN